MDHSSASRFKFLGFMPGISLRRSAEGVLGHAIAEAEPAGRPSAYLRKIRDGRYMGKLRISIEGGAVEVHAQASSPRKVLKALDARLHRKLGSNPAIECLDETADCASEMKN